MNKAPVWFLLGLLALGAGLILPANAITDSKVELPVAAVQPSEPIRGRYIVVFKDGVANPAAEARRMMHGRGGEIHYTYRHALKGFAATIPDRAYHAILRNPIVASVEQDMTVHAWNTQSNATWGIDRIDQRSLPLSGSYTYNTDGAGVYAYIIDTGIRASHVEFTGRVAPGATAINDGRGTNDCNGHGTHVAGTVGGTLYGVAKGVTLVPVRVLDCNGAGSLSGVVAGVDWITGQKRDNPGRPMVANMSLGGSANNTLDSAVSNSVAAGVVYAVAAGNDNADACTYSPARLTPALTTGATTSTDARSSFSNFGSCVDLFAPGSSIRAAWYTGDTATATLSGTSMAAPHAAGVAALVLGANPQATAADVIAAIVEQSTQGALSGIGAGSPNRLLYSLVATGEPEPVPLSITTSALPDARVGAAYAATLSASGGSPSYSWSAASLPEGLGLDASSGVISGTPQRSGSFDFAPTVTDSNGATATKTLPLRVLPPPVHVEPAVIDTIRNGGRWTSGIATVLVVESKAPYPPVAGLTVSGSWRVGGTLQSGTSSGTTGSDGMVTISSPTYRTANATIGFCVRQIQGDAAVTRTYDPPLCAGTGNLPGNNDEPAPEDPVDTVQITTSSLPPGTVGASYSAGLDATGGDGQYAWRVESGVLPSGLTLASALSMNSGGTISGIPTQPGTFEFTVMVESAGKQVTAGLSITIAASTTTDPGDETAPQVTRFEVTRSSSGPWQRASIAWIVTDDTALATVRIELLNGDTMVDSITHTLTGTNASGTDELRNRGAISAVRITVTDAAGNATSQTRQI